MVAPKKPRISSLSTRYLRGYKVGGMIFIIALCLFLAIANILTLYNNPPWWEYLLRIVQAITLPASFFFAFITINRNVYRIAFDDEFLYVLQKQQDILIPLENIKDIEIKSLGGVYEVELYQPEQLGNKFYFKPSLLYPFNFKKKDRLVDVLRANINKAQAKKQHFQANALHS